MDAGQEPVTGGRPGKGDVRGGGRYQFGESGNLSGRSDHGNGWSASIPACKLPEPTDLGFGHGLALLVIKRLAEAHPDRAGDGFQPVAIARARGMKDAVRRRGGLG